MLKYTKIMNVIGKYSLRWWVTHNKYFQKVLLEISCLGSFSWIPLARISVTSISRYSMICY